MTERLTRRAFHNGVSAAFAGMLGATRIATAQEQTLRQLSPEQKSKADHIMATLQEESKVLAALKDQYDAAISSGNAAEEKRVALEIAGQIRKMNALTEQFGEVLRTAK